MHEDILSSLERCFTPAQGWNSSYPPIYPEDYQGQVTQADVYLRQTVILPEVAPISYGSDRRCRGELILSILAEKTYGPRNIYKLADQLQSHLGEKSHGKVLTGLGYLTRIGKAPTDPSRIQYDFHLPFQYYS